MITTAAGIALCLATLAVVYLQGRFFKSHKALLFLVNSELLICLWIEQHLFHLSLAFQKIPVAGDFVSLYTLVALSFYFGGLALYLGKIKRSSQLRLMIPFAIPYVIFTLVLDILSFFPQLQAFLEASNNSPLLELTFLGALFGFMMLVAIFFPFFIQKIWKCTPLENSPLRKRLEDFCHQHRFRYAGLQIWTILGESPTAAIIGIAPRFRYIMFTPRLIKEMSPDEIEAVLAHEIGHSTHKHLLFFPFVIVGMMLFAGVFSFYVMNYLAPWIGSDPALEALILFICYAFSIAIYFRLVFGFFSRLFERQADLNVFPLNIPPEHLISALENVAKLTRQKITDPNWHHYSIAQRIAFLQKASKHPSLIRVHTAKVYVSMAAFMILLGISIWLLIFIG